jgi:hypothetical protein
MRLAVVEGSVPNRSDLDIIERLIARIGIL